MIAEANLFQETYALLIKKRKFETTENDKQKIVSLHPEKFLQNTIDIFLEHFIKIY